MGTRRLTVFTFATLAVRCVAFTSFPAAAIHRPRVLSTLRLLGSNPNHFLDNNIQALNNDYFVVRHGQSMANVERVISSNPDIATQKHGLSPTGREQAMQAGKDVVTYYQTNNDKYTGIVLLSSDFKRAKETAECLAESIREASLPLFQNAQVSEIRFRERWFGDWDGGSDSNYQHVWEGDAIDPSHSLKGVESVHSVMQRTTSCVLEWDLKFQKHLILLVAHGDVLQITQTAFLKMDGSLHRTLPHLETAALRPLVLS
jgi:probable phosphoglycerate mutase